MGVSDRSDRLALALAAVLAADAVACAIPDGFVQRDLVRLGCPVEVRRAIPVIKAGAATGLVAGTKVRTVGRLTASLVVVYFVLAVLAHVRVRDALWRYVAATGMLGLSVAVAAVSFRATDVD